MAAAKLSPKGTRKACSLVAAIGNLKTKGPPMKKRSARDNTLRILDYLGGRCYDCKRVFPIYVYDVHCPDETRKDFSFADNIKLKTFDEIKALLDGCVLVCGNCHRIRHHEKK